MTTTYQDIRRYYEQPVIDACTGAGIEYRPENTLIPNGDAVTTFVTARLQFGEMIEPVTGCAPISNTRATFIVEFYGPKGVGPKAAQDFMGGLSCTLRALKGVVSLSGPSFTSPENMPYFFSQLSFGLAIPGKLD